jgi:ABC-2 type transport system permease protein
VGLANILALSISFFCSSLFNTTRYSLAFGAGIPVMFILFNMLGGASDQAEILKKISIYGWYDPLEIVSGAETAQINLIYIGLIAALLIASVLIFKNKRLPV